MKHSPCKLSVEHYLSGQLTHAEELEFEGHLELCNHCQHQVQATAADQQSWSDAKRFLQAANKASLATVADPSLHSEPHSREFNATQVVRLLAPTDDPHMLGRVDSYEISGVIGIGGMGVVLKGWDRTLNRAVAIKLMAPHLAASGVARARFLREAQAAAGIVHPNVVDLFGVAEFQGFPYLVMPYIRGTSLQRRVQEHGPLPIEDVLRVGLQIASGLSAAHAQGIIHRDIKPANILVGEGIDRAFITDFGLARTIDDASLTRTGTISGTPQYMSPEQAKGEPIDQRSDLFSLGSVLYFLCTGQPPFRAETMYGTLHRITSGQTRDIREIQGSIPEWFQNLVARLHQVDPAQRYDSASAVAKLLEQCLAHHQQPLLHQLPKELTQGHRTRRTSHSKNSAQRFRIVTKALIAIASVASFSTISWQFWSSRPATLQSLTTSSSSSKVPAIHASADKPFQYQLQLDEAIGYLLTITGEGLDHSDLQIDALVVLKPVAISDSRIELSLSTNLTMQAGENPKQEADPELDYLSVSHSSTSHQNLTTSVSIDPRGRLLSGSPELLLPYNLGSPIAYVLPELSTTDALSLGASSHASLQGPFGGQFHFNTNEGLIESFECNGWIDSSSGAQQPIHLEVTRLSTSELNDWLRQAAMEAERGATDKAMTSTEQSQCIAELAQEQRVIFWLHRLESHSARQFAPELVDSIVNLSDHSNPTYRTLANRLVRKIPLEQQNPFRILE